MDGKAPCWVHTAAVFLLEEDLTIVEGMRLRQPGSPFSLKLRPRAVSRSVLSAVPYVEREILSTVALALFVYHTAL